jgi:hypothetical protein
MSVSLQWEVDMALDPPTITAIGGAVAAVCTAIGTALAGVAAFVIALRQPPPPPKQPETPASKPTPPSKSGS